MNLAGARHLDWSVVADLFEMETPRRIAVLGSPPVHIDVRPKDGTLALMVATGKGAPPVSTVDIIQIAVMHDSALGPVTVVSTNSLECRQSFYSLCCETADRLQLDGLAFPVALRQTIARWRGLLAMSTEGSGGDVGMFGELLVLRDIASRIGWVDAAKAWKGPQHEEHDFGLDHFDLEVKTTAAATRVHTVHGADQLKPSPGRDLWLASVHLTRGGLGGQTLRELAESLLSEADPVTNLPAQLKDIVSGPDYPDTTRWARRAPDLLLHVDTSFPAFTVSPSGPRITQYTVDLTGLVSTPDRPDAISFASEG